MHELACPTCGTSSQHDLQSYILICPFCSESFKYDRETGEKDLFPDHFIIPNSLAPTAARDNVLEWLKRLHHNPKSVEQEFIIASVEGMSIPFWVVSMEAHTAWTGLSKKHSRSMTNQGQPDYLKENGKFRRTYRWAINARSNICEMWGISRLHEPKEKIVINWDGFPVDSTFSRGHIELSNQNRSAYDAKESFEFKYSNGLPIRSVEVDEESAVRRAQQHVDHYHFLVSSEYVDYLIDCRTETEVAGIQLVHLPFWHVTYYYRPKSALKHFYKPIEKHVLVEGYSSGILKGELALTKKDKIGVNAIIGAIAAVVLFMLGATWHPAFFFVSAFAGAVSLASLYISAVRESNSHAGSHFSRQSKLDPESLEQPDRKIAEAT